MNEHTKIIEINGVKMEVDLREATTLDTYKCGDLVKILVPEYGDTFKAMAGVIIGFDNFKSRPAIVVAYLDAKFSDAEIKLAYIHDGGKHEITHASPADVPFSKEQVDQLMDRHIAAKQKELDEAQWRKRQFESWFGKYFEPATVAAD
jgi:hypothetical protein